MKKLFPLFWGYWLAVTLFSCQTSDKNAVEPDNPAGTITQKLSDMADNLQAIPLETTDSCLLSGYLQIWIGNKYIVTADRENMHLFNRNGKHIRQLMNRGKGPGQFQYINSFTVDESKERLYYCEQIEKENLRIIDLVTGNNTQKIPGYIDGADALLIRADHNLLGCSSISNLKQYKPYDLFILSEKWRNNFTYSRRYNK